VREEEAAVEKFDLAEELLCGRAPLFLRLGKAFEE